MKALPVSINAATEQCLAADGAIACFSSNFLSFSMNGDRAPQLKASVRRLSSVLMSL